MNIAATPQNTNVTKGLTTTGLKIIAVICMFIDHLGASIVDDIVMKNYIGLEENWVLILRNVYLVMRMIGRISFPIYCFFIVEGYFYTHDLKKYLQRLAILAVISEVPFDMAFSRKIFAPDYNNVFITLAIGLLTIAGIDKANSYIMNKNKGYSSHIEVIIGSTLIAATGCAAAYILKTDYSYCGIITIIIMYYNRKSASFNPVFSMIEGVIWLGISAGLVELAALIDALFIHFYNGQKGRNIKTFFYGFYPVHLAILGIINMLILKHFGAL